MTTARESDGHEPAQDQAIVVAGSETPEHPAWELSFNADSAMRHALETARFHQRAIEEAAQVLVKAGEMHPDVGQAPLRGTAMPAPD